ncbi:MAG: cellulase family glycosylhydrolase [Deltaproteobacteria bacterium]|nr:cellulase family glycosylhydrolase [Deltaproteobacteria bacterium]
MTGYCLSSCANCDPNAVTVTLDTDFDSDIDTDEANHPGYRVKGRFLYDRCDEKVILRGVNKMTVWQDKAGAAFPEIAKTGANTVRIVWTTTDGTAAQMDTVIGKAIDNELIPIIELHDATGDLTKLSAVVDWWIKPEVVAVIQKYEENLLVNIANEVGAGLSNSEFVLAYKDAITKMRNAGYKTPLIIDASGWGQNIDILQACGPTLFNFDPYSNIMFSVHMWWPTIYHAVTAEYPTLSFFINMPPGFFISCPHLFEAEFMVS